MTANLSGSLGPFEKTRLSILNMASRIQEAAVIQKIMEDPTDENMEILAHFILSDPQFLSKKDLPN